MSLSIHRSSFLSPAASSSNDVIDISEVDSTPIDMKVLLLSTPCGLISNVPRGYLF